MASTSDAPPEDPTPGRQTSRPEAPVAPADPEAARECLRAARGVHFWLIVVAGMTVYLGLVGRQQEDYDAAIAALDDLETFPTEADWREWRKSATRGVLLAYADELGPEHAVVTTGLAILAVGGPDRLGLLLDDGKPEAAPDLTARLNQLAEPRRHRWIWPELNVLLTHMNQGLFPWRGGVRLRPVAGEGDDIGARGKFPGGFDPVAGAASRRVVGARHFELEVFDGNRWEAKSRIAGLIIEDAGGPTLAGVYDTTREGGGLRLLLRERVALAGLDRAGAERHLRERQSETLAPVNAFGITIPVEAAVLLGPAALMIGYLYLGLHLRAARRFAAAGWAVWPRVAWIGSYRERTARVLTFVTLLLFPVAAAAWLAAGGLASTLLAVQLIEAGQLWILAIPLEITSLAVLAAPVLGCALWGVWPLVSGRRRPPAAEGEPGSG